MIFVLWWGGEYFVVILCWGDFDGMVSEVKWVGFVVCFDVL